MNEVRELNRKKDIVCVILSYPPFNSLNKERHRGWILDALEINDKVREALLKEKEKKFSELSFEITRLLDHSIHDIEAYVPPHIIDEMQWGPLWVRIPKAMLNLSIDFAIRQILQSTQIPKIRRIRIVTNCETFLSRLKNLPQVREIFNIVIQVDVKHCTKVEDIEDEIIGKMGFPKSSKQQVDELLLERNFLILLENLAHGINLHKVGTTWWNSSNIQKIAFTTKSQDPQGVLVDLEISLEYHMLSWVLFCRNVGEVVSSSSIQQLAVQVLTQCSGHLLVTVLMARVLREVKDVHIWKYASRLLSFQRTSRTEDRILLNALVFIREHLYFGYKCLRYHASYPEMERMDKLDLIEGLMKDGLIVQDLVNAFLLETFGNRDLVRVRDKIHKELVNLQKIKMNPTVFLERRGLMEAPKNEAWEEANEIHLTNDKISDLPENPSCPELNVLFLQVNQHLRVIPPLFFESMPLLQILDLSQTRIKSLPESFFKLVQLRKFYLRGCELFKELSSEVGELCHLEVLDLEGTEITNLPVAVGKLTNLTCLKLSFYNNTNRNRKNNHSNKVIPQNVISNLLQLEELSIDVNPIDERWNVSVKDVIEEVCSLNRLETLKLYFPEVVFSYDLKNRLSSINMSSMRFRFIIGSHLKRIISRLPLEAEVKFEEERCLKYVNGENVPTEIKELLVHATSFFLDRHLRVTSLSEFGIENLKNLKFCVIQECNEIQTVVDIKRRENLLLASLEHLNLHYMRNLRNIWKGPIGWGSLYHLKALTLHSCPKLTTIFTSDFLLNLRNLEELVVEDCPEINSILTLPAENLSPLMGYVPKLKKISLHYLPKLVSISSGLMTLSKLEWMSCYDCPNLKTLSPEEVSSNDLKAIIGEADWWGKLQWNKSTRFQPPKLDAIFVSIEKEADLRTQLAEIKDQLQSLDTRDSLLDSQVKDSLWSCRKHPNKPVHILA